MKDNESKSVFDTLADKTNKARADAIKNYGTILHRANNPAAGDDKRLAEVMSELGLTLAQVRDDADALAQVDAAQSKVPTADAMEELNNQAASAANKLDAHVKESREKQEVLMDALKAASRAFSFARTDKQNAEDVRERLTTAHPLAFGVDPLAPAEQQKAPEPEPENHTTGTVCSLQPSKAPAGNAIRDAGGSSTLGSIAHV